MCKVLRQFHTPTYCSSPICASRSSFQIADQANLDKLISPSSSASKDQQDADLSSSLRASGSARCRSCSSVHRCCSHSVTRTETLLKHAMTFLASLGRAIMPVLVPCACAFWSALADALHCVCLRPIRIHVFVTFAFIG